MMRRKNKGSIRDGSGRAARLFKIKLKARGLNVQSSAALRTVPGHGHSAHVLCLIVEAGEEEQVRPTLDQLLTEAVADGDLVVLRLGNVRLPSLEHLPGAPRAVRVIDAAVDRHGPLHQALTVLRPIYPCHDFLLLRPGIRVPRAWDGRLRFAALSDRMVGAASPLSAEWASLGAAKESGSDTAIIDGWVYAMGERENVEVQGLSPHCVWLRQEALDAVANEVEDFPGAAADFSAYLSRQLHYRGYSSVVADHLWIDTPATVEPTDSPIRSIDGARASEPRPDAFRALERAVHHARQQGHAPGPISGVNGKPLQLHVMHNWGGGLGRWVEDYCHADRLRTNMVLKPIGDAKCYALGLELYRHIDDPQPIRCWKLKQPIATIAITHLEYRQILAEIVETYGVSTIVVSSLFGHSLDALATSVPTIGVCHDYFPFCAAVSLNYCDKTGGANTICTSCSPERLQLCFSSNRFNRFLPGVTADHWLAVRRRWLDVVLRRSLPLVVPTLSVHENLLKLAPSLGRLTFTVIPHGMEPFRRAEASANSDVPRQPGARTLLQRGAMPISAESTPPAGPKLALETLDRHNEAGPRLREAAPRLRVVVLGRMTPEKGSQVLLDACDELTRCCDLYLLGCGNDGARFQGRPGVTIIPRYERSELPALLAEIGPDCGLLLSVCAETFSYTLSELMSLGVPPVATRLGGFADRIQDGVTGFLITPTSDSLVRKVHELAKDRLPLAAVRRNLAGMPPRSTAEMVADYEQLLPLPRFNQVLYARGLPESAQAPIDQLLWRQEILEETFAQMLDRAYHTLRVKIALTPRLRNWQRRVFVVTVAVAFRAVKLACRMLGAGSPAVPLPVAAEPQEAVAGRRAAA